MDDNCGEWVECMGVASGCGEEEEEEEKEEDEHNSLS